MLVDILKKDILSNTDQHFLYAFYLAGFLTWILLSFPLFSVFQWTQKLSPVLRIFTILLMGPITGSIKVLISWTTYYFSYTTVNQVSISILDFLSRQTTFHYVEATIIVWVVLLLFFLNELYQKYRLKTTEAAELESKLYQSQLKALKMQLQPHFLFNAHNTIAMLIRTQKYEQAIDITSRLSELLRATLNTKGHPYVPLNQEISLVKKYLEIELIRFEETLEVSMNLAPETEKALLPNMLLQPIVENAFKHGISKHLGASKMDISSMVHHDRLRVSIYNTGPAIPQNFHWQEFPGIGLSNAYQRLDQSYHGDFSFELNNHEDGVKCEIEIPLTFE